MKAIWLSIARQSIGLFVLLLPLYVEAAQAKAEDKWFESVSVMCRQPYEHMTNAIRDKYLNYSKLIKTGSASPTRNQYIWIKLDEKRYTQLIKAKNTGVVSAEMTLNKDKTSWLKEHLKGQGDAGVPFFLTALGALPNAYVAATAVGMSLLDWAIKNSDSVQTAKGLAEVIADGGVWRTVDYLRYELREDTNKVGLFFYTTLQYVVKVGKENRIYIVDSCRYAVDDRTF